VRCDYFHGALTVRLSLIGSFGESMVSETFRGLIERADHYARQEKFRKLDERRDLMERIGHSVLVQS
jgi:hypothetical protein